jgi:hypothetical protein
MQYNFVKVGWKKSHYKMDGIKKVRTIKKISARQLFSEEAAALETKTETRPTHSIGFFTKLIVAVVLVTLTPLVVPHESIAAEVEEEITIPLIFEVGDAVDYVQNFQENLEQQSLQARHELAVTKLQKQLKLSAAVKQYLIANRSPLAEYSSILIQQNNWKKIVALSNAESTMCRHYVEATANCWGVGGSDLWDMGANLGEGIVSMNNFLNTAPRLSSIKYSQMNFEQMNGLYKQPARDHWVYNNLAVYNELIALEKAIK